MQITRIRLSDKTSRLHPRRTTPKLDQAYESEVPVQVREWIAPAPASPDFVLVTQPHAFPEGFNRFVTSTVAPVASGWSTCRVGLSPTGKHRLSTAHTPCSHLGLSAFGNRNVRGVVDPRPPASIRHRSSARPAAGNDDGFVEGLPIFLLADRIHRPKFRQQRVDQ